MSYGTYSHIHNYHVIINFKRIELNSYVERIDECLILEETAIARLASGMDVELKNIGKN